MLVYIHLWYKIIFNFLAKYFPLQIVRNKFSIWRMESKSWWQVHITQYFHFYNISALTTKHKQKHKHDQNHNTSKVWILKWSMQAIMTANAEYILICQMIYINNHASKGRIHIKLINSSSRRGSWGFGSQHKAEISKALQQKYRRIWVLPSFTLHMAK